jgi:antitoxin MazE
MKLQVAQWGNSAGLRLPRALLDELRIAPGSELDAWVRGGELHLRPVPPVTSYRLEDLLERITPDSVPEFQRWPLVGNEIIDDDYSR